MFHPLEQDQLDALDSGAIITPCGRYRYLLWRRWDPQRPVCMFIGLNPSTADETEDDPTIRRCINFAKAWGYGSLWMTNLCAFRATDPDIMRARQGAAIGPRNDEYLITCGRAAGIVVAAWGTGGVFRRREANVREYMEGSSIPLYYLKLTKDGHPSHPLYLPGTLVPREWRALSGVHD